jgi:hypothetical protein
MAGTGQRIYMVRSGTSATVTTPVALSAATTKTVVAVLGTAADTIALKRIRVSFNSVAAADVPALVEVGIITALGTVSAVTPVQVAGSTVASSCTAGYNATAESTYNRVFESTYVPVNNGLMEWWYPLGEEPQCDPSQGIAIRVTSPSAVSCLASILFAE